MQGVKAPTSGDLMETAEASMLLNGAQQEVGLQSASSSSVQTPSVLPLLAAYPYSWPYAPCALLPATLRTPSTPTAIYPFTLTEGVNRQLVQWASFNASLELLLRQYQPAKVMGAGSTLGAANLPTAGENCPQANGAGAKAALCDEDGSRTSSLDSTPYDESEKAKGTAAACSSGASSQEGRFQDGVTVGYTYDALFISDGRSKRRVHQGAGQGDVERHRYTCNQCGKTYATSSNLSRHRQTHRSLDSTYAKKCPDCGKVYVSMPALSMHLLTHKLEHCCKICGKAFSRPWLLQGHMRSHTGHKPFGCAHCGKAFADRSNLRAHMQTHIHQKRYKCKQCDKAFALKSYLTKHKESGCQAKLQHQQHTVYSTPGP